MNDLFLAYAKHTQEVEDVINMICTGGTSFQLDDDFGPSDLQYIKSEVYKRTGMVVDLSLS